MYLGDVMIHIAAYLMVYRTGTRVEKPVTETIYSLKRLLGASLEYLVRNKKLMSEYYIVMFFLMLLSLLLFQTYCYGRNMFQEEED